MFHFKFSNVQTSIIILNHTSFYANNSIFDLHQLKWDKQKAFLHQLNETEVVIIMDFQIKENWIFCPNFA